MRVVSGPAGTLLLAALVAAPGVARAQFSGGFAAPNWTLTDNAGGLVDLSLAPSQITLIDGANQVGGTTAYTISSPYSVVLSFNWSYLNNDLYQDPLFEPAYYLLNGKVTELTDDLGSPAQSGTLTISLNAGDVFGFELGTFDGYYGGYNGQYGSAFLSIADFAVPEPASLALLACGAAAVGVAARRRAARASISI